jgi:hypothetical protein
MHRTRWLTGFVAVLLSIAGCGDGGGSGVAEVGSASHSWGGYHWARQANPFTLKAGDNLSSEWDSSFSGALSDWSQSTVLDMIPWAGQTTTRRCRPTLGRVEVCNDTYGGQWLGLATIWITGSVHITQGTVKLNDRYFGSGSTYNTPAWRNLVTCQEIGHTLGLDHQDENFNNANLGTCMDYTNDPSTNQHPNKHDYDELLIIYGHLDSTTTVDTGSAALARNLPPQASDNADPDPDDVGPPAWGALVRQSPDGKLQVWELDLGGGNKVVRFVRKP